MKPRTFAIGDIHGRHKALLEVLKKSRFDYQKDKLIILGDICDGGHDTYDVIEELLKIKNQVYILGNHDLWAMDYFHAGWSGNIWIQQGGSATLQSYGAKVNENGMVVDEAEVDATYFNIPKTHKDFFNTGKLYHIENNMLFIHGGIDPTKPIDFQTKQTLIWDRSIIQYAMRRKVQTWDKIFIGHTTTECVDKGCLTPIKLNNLIMLDTGAGWNGKLTIMDVNTEKYWQSEKQTGGRT